MPGVYKEKNCPNCGVTHRKRGEYCCQRCAAESRTVTEETKEKISDSLKDYLLTPEGQANLRIASQRSTAYLTGAPMPVTIDEFAVGIPDIPELPDGYDTNDWR